MLWPASASVMLNVPVAVGTVSSVTLPLVVPEITGASAVPLIVIVTVLAAEVDVSAAPLSSAAVTL